MAVEGRGSLSMGKLTSGWHQDSFLPDRMGPAKKRDRYLFGAIGIYLLAGIILIGRFRYQINPDALSYISIAQHYHDGFWQDAVNAYWSPLYSWLLVPLLFLGVDPLLAAKILSLIFGSIVLAGSWQLATVVGLSSPFRRILVFSLIPIILEWALSVVSPDLLTIALLLPFLSLILRPDFLARPLVGLVAGLCGGLAYLSKAYALPFVIVMFVMCALWQTFAIHRSVGTLARKAFGFLAGLATLTLPWVAVISNAYQRLTFGTASRFNFALIGPDSLWYPMLTLGLFPPANGHALSSWEDPGLLPQRIWSPLSSAANFTFWLQNIASNWGAFYEILNGFSLLALPALGAGFFMAIQRMRRDQRRYDPGVALLLSLLIFAGGYTLVFLEKRYIWICAIEILLGSLLAIQIGSVSYRLNKRWAFLLVLALSLSFAFPAISWFREHLGMEDREYYDAAQELPEMRGSHFASNDAAALYYAYYKGAKFYGLPKGDPEKIAQQFKQYHIDKYFLIGPNISPPPFVEEANRIDSGNIPNLRVYRVPDGGKP